MVPAVLSVPLPSAWGLCVSALIEPSGSNTALTCLLCPKGCSVLQQKFLNCVDPTAFSALKLKYWVAPFIIKCIFS